MKTLSRRFASVVFGFSILLAIVQLASAAIEVESTSSFGSVSIDPSIGIVNYIGTQSSAYGQAGANAQYNNSLASSTASSADMPVPGGSATGAGSASASPFSGSSSATGYIPGSIAGFDTSAGRASISGEFEITGASGTMAVTFSAVIGGQLTLN